MVISIFVKSIFFFFGFGIVVYNVVEFVEEGIGIGLWLLGLLLGGLSGLGGVGDE